MFVQNQNRFFVIGIVSAALTVNGFCDLRNFALFTDVPKMRSWIEQNVKRLEGNYNDRVSLRQAVNAPTRLAAGVACGAMKETTSLMPWTALIFKQDDFSRNYATGTIISSKHVFAEPLMLSFMNNAGFSLPLVHELAVAAGAFDLDAVSKNDYMNVLEMIIHPSYKASLPTIANIAILVLAIPLQLSDNVVPICLWDSPINVNSFEGQQVYAVGFRRDLQSVHIDKSRSKKLTSMTVGTTKECPFIITFFLNSISNRDHFFCATINNGSTCISDSFTLYKQHQGSWYLFAVGSYLEVQYETKVCQENNSMYEYLPIYVDWIRDILST